MELFTERKNRVYKQGIGREEWASLVAQRLKRLPLIQETWVRSLGREDNKQKSLQIGRRKYDLLTNIVT